MTEAPARAALGETLLMLGAGIVNDVLLLAIPMLVVTTKLPLVASAGTLALMLVLLHEITCAEMPLKVTVPVVVPKLLPLIAIAAPAVPERGATELTTGGGTTGKCHAVACDAVAVTVPSRADPLGPEPRSKCRSSLRPLPPSR